MQRVTVFKNGSTSGGKVVELKDSLDALYMSIIEKLDVNGTILFTAKGGEVDDIRLVRDEDVLYVSTGEPFIELSPSGNEQSKCVCLNRENVSTRQTECEQTNLNPFRSYQNEQSECEGSFPRPFNRSGAHSQMHPDWLLLNVGGRHFATTRSTLTRHEPSSMLARMVGAEGTMAPSALDAHGALLVDRSPLYFEPILNYLRHGQLVMDRDTNPRGVLEEARFYGIESLVTILEKSTEEEEREGKEDPSERPLTRRDVVRSLISTSYLSELRFQGVNLSGADLSRLDLRHINLKYANLHQAKLSGTNLSYCCLERADLSHANLEGAVLLGVKMLCANLEGANLRSCNMEDPAGHRANMEGVNLKGADLEGSQMAGVNLRVATLKKANLQNCDLRGAVLAGADLEHCDLSGSDLHEANLRGANLKDTAFELMLTPLHMAQAIR